jgi:NADPH2:quinone reductase
MEETVRAIRVAAPGGPEAMELVVVPRPSPARGEALVRLAAIGVNFIDVYHRTGLYRLATPFTPGSEAAGVVEEVGEGVTGLAPGERVAWAMTPGAYAELAAVPVERLVPVPDGIELRTAAATLLQGMTAHYLATDTHRLGPGQTALVHAAAGGVGALLVQVAKLRGARVFGTASTAKLAVVREAGADEAIDYTAVDFQAEVLRLTGGRGVDAVYDSVGRTTFDGSLAVVARRGTLALFGQSSGPVAPVDPLRLAKNGIYLTRPSLAHYTATREELLGRAGEVFGWIGAGTLRPRVERELPLADAAVAHRLLEGRATAGKLLLIP